MTSTDPLLRALADGDQGCPDGAALSRLGRLIRAQTPPGQADLRPQLQQRLADSANDDDTAHIDDHYCGLRSDHRLARLDALVSVPLPRPVDLRDRVRARIADSHRLKIVDPGTSQRHRLISAVVVAHLAAALVFAVVRFGNPADEAPRMATDSPAMAPGPATLPTQLPARWSELRHSGGDLFQLRRSADVRTAARAAWGTTRSAGDVAGSVRWLVSQAANDGRIGPVLTDGDCAAATQGLATLALLGEGFGDTARVSTARNACAWLAAQPSPRSAAAQGIATLALVEGGLLLSDPRLCAVATARLADLGLLPGHDVFTVLAIECAWQGGLDVPQRLLEQTRHSLARSLPDADERDPRRLGLAALGRSINGHVGASTISLAGRLAAVAPHTTANMDVTDPLAWFSATLALRDLGGATWVTWVTGLQDATEPTFTRREGLAWVEAARVRHAQTAGGDIFATAATVLNLQAAYRYLPVAAGR